MMSIQTVETGLDLGTKFFNQSVSLFFRAANGK